MSRIHSFIVEHPKLMHHCVTVCNGTIKCFLQGQHSELEAVHKATLHFMCMYIFDGEIIHWNSLLAKKDLIFAIQYTVQCI